MRSCRAATAARAALRASSSSAFRSASATFSASIRFNSCSAFSAAARASAAARSAAAIRSSAAISSAFAFASSRAAAFCSSVPSLISLSAFATRSATVSSCAVSALSGVAAVGRSSPGRFPRLNPVFSGWSPENRASSFCSADRFAMAAVPATVAAMAPTTAPNFNNPLLLILFRPLKRRALPSGYCPSFYHVSKYSTMSPLKITKGTSPQKNKTGSAAGPFRSHSFCGKAVVTLPERSHPCQRRKAGRPSPREVLQKQCRLRCRYRDRRLRGRRCNHKHRIRTS